MIFDAHAHLFSRTFYQLLFKQKTGREGSEAELREMLAPTGLELPPADPMEHAARWIRELDGSGVNRMVLFTSLPGEQTAVAAAAKAFPHRLTGYTMVNPLAPDALAIARRDLTELGLRGIELFPAMHRFDPSDEKLVYPFYELASQHAVPIFCHVGILRVKLREKLGLRSPFDARFSNPVLLHRAATDNPKTNFIIPHFGCGYLREAVFLGLQCPNVFVDTSSSNEWMSLLEQPVTLVRALTMCLDAFGPERILFGTDSSVLPRGYRADILVALQNAFEQLQLEPSVRAQILGENLSRLHIQRTDFVACYARGETPWDSGRVCPELQRVLDSGQLQGASVLEIGCGTGTNAIEFARRGMKVVAFDPVPQAIEVARERAKQSGVHVDFRVADALTADLGGPYDILFDHGVYHYLRKIDLPKYLAMLQRVSRPGTLYFSLSGNGKERTEYGPPRVSESDIRNELGTLFDILELRETQFDTNSPDFRPLAWAVLMKRK